MEKRSNETANEEHTKGQAGTRKEQRKWRDKEGDGDEEANDFLNMGGQRQEAKTNHQQDKNDR